MGGLARRATFVKKFAAENPGASIIQVDAGGLLNPRVSDPPKARTMIEALGKLGVDVVNLSPGDALHLAKIEAAARPKQVNFVTANVFGPGRKTLAPAYVVRRAAGTRLIIAGISALSHFERYGQEVDEPRAALEKLLGQVRRDGDIVVLLAWMPNREVMDIAINVPGVDLIVSGYEGQNALEPYQVGNAWVLQAQYEGKMIGQVELDLTPDKRLDKFASRTIVGLDASFEDEPEMAALVSRLKNSQAAQAGGGHVH